MASTQDLADAAVQLNATQVYIGCGNWVTYFDKDRGLQRHMVLKHERGADHVEVVAHENGERVFRVIALADIVTINDQRVSIVK
jgi:hypothetical protein